MNETTDRAWLHRYADLIDEADIPEMKMILQQYAARTLNRKYKEDTKHEDK